MARSRKRKPAAPTTNTGLIKTNTAEIVKELDKQAGFIANAMTARKEWLNSLLDPRRDYDKECGYPQSPSAEMYRAQFDRNPIARRVTELYPLECWKGSPTVYEKEDPEVETPFEQAWHEVARYLDGKSLFQDEDGNPIWNELRLADIVSGIGHYGVILLGIDDGLSLDQPVDGVEEYIYGEIMGKMAMTHGGGEGSEDQYGYPWKLPKDLFTSEPQSPNGQKQRIKPKFGNEPPTGNAFPPPKKKRPNGPPEEEDVPSGPPAPGAAPSSGPPRPGSGPPKPPTDSGPPGSTGNVPPEGPGPVNPDSPPIKHGFGEGDKLLTEDPSELGPKPPIETKHKLLYIRCFDETLAQIVQYENDPTNPRFGQPRMYNLYFEDPNTVPDQATEAPNIQSRNVHWTRVVHIADNTLSSKVSGIPRQQVVFNRLIDLIKLYGGSAEMFWQGAFPGYSIETIPQLGGDVEIDTAAVRSAMENYMNTLQRWISTMGMQVKSLAPQIADPTANIDVQLTAICVVLACPKRVFMGSERGELASSQDKETWTERVRERQQNYLTPKVIVPFVNRLIAIGVLPEPTGFSVVWPEHDELSKAERAQIAFQMTQALGAYVSQGVDAIMAPMDYLVTICGFKEEEVSQFLDAVSEHLQEVNPETTDGALVPGHAPEPPQMAFDEFGNPIEPEEGGAPFGGEEGDDEEAPPEDEEDDSEGPPAFGGKKKQPPPFVKNNRLQSIVNSLKRSHRLNGTKPRWAPLKELKDRPVTNIGFDLSEGEQQYEAMRKYIMDLKGKSTDALALEYDTARVVDTDTWKIPHVWEELRQRGISV